jgi:hemerythrin-like metal-binding protein
MIGDELIIWNDHLQTGVPQIDEQHRILVNSINEANTRLRLEFNAQTLEQITRDLLSYALYHFETEEELMLAHHYTEQDAIDAQIHLKQHREFSTMVVSVRDGIKAGKLISREELLSFLNNWLINHILNTDKRLATFILQQG